MRRVKIRKGYLYIKFNLLKWEVTAQDRGRQSKVSKMGSDKSWFGFA